MLGKGNKYQKKTITGIPFGDANDLKSPAASPISFLNVISPHITGIKKQREKRAALFSIPVNVIVMCYNLSVSNVKTSPSFGIYTFDSKPLLSSSCFSCERVVGQ